MSTPDPASDRFAACMRSVATELLGQPTTLHGNEMRFGTRGSLSVDPNRGVWCDHESGESGGVLDLIKRQQSTDAAGAFRYLEQHGHIEPPHALCPSKPRPPEIEAVYDYVDEAGDLLFQVCRMKPKDFRQRRPDGAGGFIWKTGGVRRVVYHLPEVIKAVAAGRTIYVVEGEKAVDRLLKLHVAATCSPGGANKWSASYSSALTSADVVILPDNDEPGRQHAATVERALHGVAARIRIVDLPGLPPKADVFDWIEAGGTRAQLETLIEKTTDQQPSPAAAPTALETEPNLPNRPLVKVVAGHLHTMADEAEQAVIAAGEPIYQRGNKLVRPIRRELPAAHGRSTVAAGLSALDLATAVDLLSKVARWERFDGRTKEWLQTDPPERVAKILLARKGRWTVPHIAGVITTPTMRPDGSILSAPGYDAITRLYHEHDASVVLSPAVARPTQLDADRAMGDLQKVIAEFPFEGDVARAVALSCIITPVVRGALAVVPLHAIRARTAGTGKSYLVDVASTIATGRPCPVTSVAPDNERETEKRLTGLLLAGFPLLSLDNVNGELGGDLLCQAIERLLVRLRPLGRSDIVEIESRATIMATGNNLRVRGDMVRRTIVCELDAGLERPELRQFQDDPVAIVLSDRGRYVSAALVIVRAYILAGQPDQLPPIASFSDWSGTVRSALVWLGCADPAASMETARADDPELETIREVMVAWHGANGPAGTTCRRTIALASERCARADEDGDHASYAPQHGLRFPGLHDALARVAIARNVLDAPRLGRWLQAKEGRIVDGRRFKRDGTTEGSARWMLEQVGRA